MTYAISALSGSPAASLLRAALNFSTLIVAYGPKGREQGIEGTGNKNASEEVKE
jgi:hypothetical protein